MLYCLLRKQIQYFCKFRFFKELANQISFTLPNINRDLGYSLEDKCWLLGYRIKQQITSNSDDLTEKHQVSKLSEVILEADPEHRQQLKFSQILQYASKNDLDVCQVDAESKQVSLVKLRQTVYRNYYQRKLFKLNSTARKTKQIRLTENIGENDMLNKVNQIKGMVKKGQFKFKVYTQTESEKSEKVLQKFCKLIEKKGQIKIEQHVVRQKRYKKPEIKVQRWMVLLDFSSVSKIDYEKINKKWNRICFNRKKSQESQQNQELKDDDPGYFQGLKDEQITFQREILSDLRKLKMPLPKDFKDYEKIENHSSYSQMFGIQSDEQQKSFSKTSNNNEEERQEMEDQLKEKEQEKRRRKLKRKGIYSPEQNQRLAETHARLKEELKELKGSRADMADMMKLLKNRSVQQIVDEIEEISKGKKVLNSFEEHRIRELNRQLEQTLQEKGYKGKL